MSNVGDKVCFYGGINVFTVSEVHKNEDFVTAVDAYGSVYRIMKKDIELSFREDNPKNTFTIKQGQIEAAARFIVANNSYLHHHTVDSMIEKIKRTIRRMVDEINSGKDSWYTGTAGYVVTIMQEDENYYVVEVLVNPSVSQDKEFINVEEII